MLNQNKNPQDPKSQPPEGGTMAGSPTGLPDIESLLLGPETAKQNRLERLRKQYKEQEALKAQGGHSFFEIPDPDAGETPSPS